MSDRAPSLPAAPCSYGCGDDDCRENGCRTEPRRETWYFTFGFDHQHTGRFVVIEDATYDEARDRMFAAFGREWGFQYDESQWHRNGVSQEQKWRLKRLDIPS